MASKDQIKKHLSISSNIKLNQTTPLNGEAIRKINMMEHINKSKGEYKG